MTAARSPRTLADSAEASAATTNVYGYLLGNVNPPGGREGTIRFKDYQVKGSDVPFGNFTLELLFHQPGKSEAEI